MNERNASELRAAYYAKAIKLLARRDHSESELRRKLKPADDDLDIVESVLQQLVEQRYLCNRRFVSMLCRSRYERGYGLRYIRQELSQHQLSSELVSEVLAEQALDWFQRALDLRRKRCPVIPQDFKEKQKHMAYLMRRGFSDEEVRYAMSASSED